MREIARRAGVSYGIVYKHFPSQAALLSAATGTQYKQVENAWLAAQSIADPIDRIIAMCIAPFAIFPEITGFRTAAFMSLMGNPKTKARVQSMATAANGLFRKALRRAKQQGYFRGLPEETLALTLLGIPVVYTSDYLVPEEPDWKKVERDIARLIRGLAEATRIAAAA
jgi:AcrR family transcriptional regulator